MRHHAIDILAGLESGRRFATELIDDLDGKHRFSARDRRFLTELVFGISRRRLTLDAVIDAYMAKPEKGLEPRLRHCLRIALYQILFLDGIPPHAAVSEAVGLVKGPKHQRSFVNGVLRTLLREMKKVEAGYDRGDAKEQRRLEIEGRSVCFFPRDVFVDPNEDPVRHLAQVQSFPLELAKRWVDRYGVEGARALMSQSNHRPVTYLRVNRNLSTRDMTRDKLLEAGLEVADGPGEDCLVLGAPVAKLVKSAAFKRGFVSIQGAFAQLAAPFLNPQEGECVVDVGAAPGGKSTHIAELQRDRGRVISVDPDTRRLNMLREGAERLQLQSITCVASDIRDAVLKLPEGGADAVLLDAPCSNTAVLSRRPEARFRVTEETMGSLVQLQDQLLRASASLVRPGGRLLYSTCSLEPEENESVVDRFLEFHPEFRKRRERINLPSPTLADGGYQSLLLRQERSEG